MSILSTAGKNSGQKNKLESLSSGRTTSECVQIPTVFHFWNQDEYTGQFAVLPSKQKVVMQGRGVYKTADGHIYEGFWENDCLKEEAKVIFPDKSVFSGNLEEMIIQGQGTYRFKQKVEIEGIFENNVLVRNMSLKDPNQHIWEGKLAKDGIDFYPTNPFWQSVLSLPSKTSQLFYGEAEENDSIWERPY